MVQALREHPADELRRARKHHRRALKALRSGAYEALSDGTREQLLERFHVNLQALNSALRADGAPGADRDSQSPSSPPSSFSFMQKALMWLW
jgi:hypothetical protein